MDGAQETKNNNTKPAFPRAFKDLVLLIGISFLALLLSYFFNILGLIVEYLQRHPDKILYVDEIITTLLTLSIGLAVFAWRRWLDLKKEAAERIKKQEELLRVTATEAETERIISKQLRVDMDQMKQDVREILHFLLNKHNKAA